MTVTELWRITLFGGFRAERGGQICEKTRLTKDRVLLAILASHMGKSDGTAQPRTVLVDQVWPWLDEETGRKAFRESLSHLRSIFEPIKIERGKVLIADKESVRLNPEFVSADVQEFQVAYNAAHGKESAQEASFLIRAVSIYRGELLPSLYDKKIIELRGYYGACYLDALRRLSRSYGYGCRYPEAVYFLNKRIAADSLDEDAYYLLARVYGADGHLSAAEATLAKLGQALHSELGENIDKWGDSRQEARAIKRLIGLARNQAGTAAMVGWLPGALPDPTLPPISNASPLEEDAQKESIPANLTVASVDSSIYILDLQFSIPGDRNPWFCGREEILGALQTARGQIGYTGAIQALCGMSGGGKTSAALEYAHRCRAGMAGYQPYRAIQFVRADTRDSLSHGYWQIANRIQLPRADPANRDEAARAVLKWMCEPADLPFLLVLDNLEDPSLLSDFLPQEPDRQLGHVLITCLSPLIGHRVEALKVDPWDENDAALFLMKRLGQHQAWNEKEERSARDLATAMGGLPLGLEQAAAYVTCENAMPMSAYLALFRDERHRAKLLMQEPEYGFYRSYDPQTHEYRHTLTVLTTWQLSLGKIQETMPAAASMLRRCALLDSCGIPQQLVFDLCPESFLSEGDPQERDQLYYRMLSALARYSLIRCDHAEYNHRVHTLLQSVLRLRHTVEELRELTTRSAQAIIRSARTDPFDRHAREPLYYAHATRVCTFAQQFGITGVPVGQLLYMLGKWLYIWGRYAESEGRLLQAREMLENTWDVEELDLFSCLITLGSLYGKLNNYDEALQQFSHARAIWMSDETQTQSQATRARALYKLYNAIGSTYIEFKHYDKAEPVLKYVLAGRRKHFPNDTSPILQSLNNLTTLYIVQRRYDEAEQLMREAMEIVKGNHSDGSYELANLSLTLASVHYNMNKYAEALPLFERSLTIQQARYGDGSPRTIQSLNNLAMTYLRLGQSDLAERLLNERMQIVHEAFPEDHPEVARNYHNLAEVYQEQGRYAEAITLAERALKLRQHAHGDDHPDTAKSMQVLADLQNALKQG